MNCKRALPLLSEYIDNSLSARDTWEVDRHLAGCNGCTRALNELRRTVDIVAESARFEVSPDFISCLQSRLEGLEPSTERRGGGFLGVVSYCPPRPPGRGARARLPFPFVF